MYLPECLPCAGLAQHTAKLHCVHFDGKVIHLHEEAVGSMHSVCGPEHGVLVSKGATVHIDGSTRFWSLTAAKDEFTRRAETLRLGRQDAEDNRN